MRRGFGGKRLSGLKGQRVDLSMNKSVSVYFFFPPGEGRSLSNSKERWNLDDSVGLCAIIQSFSPLSQPHKRPRG